MVCKIAASGVSSNSCAKYIIAYKDCYDTKPITIDWEYSEPKFSDDGMYSGRHTVIYINGKRADGKINILREYHRFYVEFQNELGGTNNIGHPKNVRIIFDDITDEGLESLRIPQKEIFFHW